MQSIGSLSWRVLQAARRAMREKERATAEVGVTATTAVAFGKQNELNLGAGRSGIGRIADLGASGEADKRGHSSPKSRTSQGGTRSSRTD